MSDLDKILKEKLKDKYNQNNKALSYEERYENLQQWLGNSEIRDVVYHGSINDFEKFDISKTSHLGYIGRGFYFSSSLDDINTNYANDKGVDLVNKISFYKETVEQMIDMYEGDPYDEDNFIYKLINKEKKITEEEFSDLSAEQKEQIVLNAFMQIKLGNQEEGFAPVVYPVYIKMENPFYAYEWQSFDESSSDQKLIDEILEHPKVAQFLEDNDLSIYDISPLIRDGMEAYINYYAYNGLPYTLDKNSDFIEDADFSEYDEIEEDLKDVLWKAASEIIHTKYDNSFEYTDRPEGVYTLLTDALEKMLKENNIYGEEEFGNLRNFMYFDNYEPLNFEIYKEKIQEHGIADLIDGYGQELHNDNTMGTNISDVLSQCIQKIGYDGFVMDAGETFKNMKDVYPGETMHYIVFNPNQIKSAIGNNGLFNANDERFAFKLNEFNKKQKYNKNNLLFEDANEILNDFESKLPNIKGMVKLYKSPNELPTELKDQLIKSDSKACAVFDKNSEKISVFLFNINNKTQLEHTIAHEIVGHLGVKRVLGKDYNEYLEKAYDFYNKNGDLKEIKDKYSKVYKNDDASFKRMVAEEKIAETVEKYGSKKIPFYKTIVGKIKSNIQKIFPSIKFEINQHDINYLIEKSYSSLNIQEDNKKKQKRKLRV